ncbi:mitochondrial chaperone BCS1 [Colletotrichum filicis]|nr:mitochondrial chaperone BCS1 [Colletotrichum filicis]
MSRSAPLSRLPDLKPGSEILNSLSLVLGAVLVIITFVRHMPGFHEVESVLIEFAKTYWGRQTQTVKIFNDDSLYYIILSWASKQEKNSGQERVIATIDHGPYPVRLQRVLSGVWPPVESPDFTPDSGSVSFVHEGQKRVGESKEFVIFSTRSKKISLNDLITRIHREGRELRLRKCEVYRSTFNQNDQKAEWRLVASQSREMDTIALAPKTRQKLLEDLDSFLQPSMAAWHKARGIPYRRGYFFHGPPGTGKTSVSMALGTHFHLPIYRFSLGSIGMNDDCLAELFDSIPIKCLLLFEDIDTSGLVNRQASPIEGQGGITLSGLLNLIDGVGAPEGRILIMTTNDPGTLDKALVRPGRIDMVCHFPKADKDCAKFLFRSLLSAEKEIEQMAEHFANVIPDGECSPAELQSYLIDARGSPQEALEGVDEWLGKRSEGMSEI